MNVDYYRDKVNKQLAKSFMSGEFCCPHCQDTIIYMPLVNKLQGIRDYLGVPLKIMSGYRCIEHNKEVGGSDESYHITGLAADLYAPSLSLKELWNSLGEYGVEKFDGIGLYPDNNIIHLDL